jgi:hypothetical protein
MSGAVAHAPGPRHAPAHHLPFCQLALFWRLAGRTADLVAAASLPFFPVIGSSISAWPSMRLRPFFGGAGARFSCAILRLSASMRFTTFCGRATDRSRGAGMAGLLLLEHFDDRFLEVDNELRRVEVGFLVLCRICSASFSGGHAFRSRSH